jgi:predicted ATPase
MVDSQKRDTQNFVAAFNDSSLAVHAMLAAARLLQRIYLAQNWSQTEVMPVKMAICSGLADNQQAAQAYVEVNALKHGQEFLTLAQNGQILVSEATTERLSELPLEVNLQTYGRYQFKYLDGLTSQAHPNWQTTEQVFQLITPDLSFGLTALSNPSISTLLLMLNMPPNNLPSLSANFIGREAELARVKQKLTSSTVFGKTEQLVTLTGPGGAGKTTLAYKIATELLPTFSDGVWIVELSSIDNPLRVVQAITNTLKIPEQSSLLLLTTLSNYLRTRHLLLVLDNCEHVLDACRDLIGVLLPNCHNLRILVTSQHALGLAGEVELHIQPLALPGVLSESRLSPENLSKYEAVHLFTDKATVVQPDFKVTRQNSTTLIQICRYLAGLPLAIELTAVNLQTLTLEQLLERLDGYFVENEVAQPQFNYYAESLRPVPTTPEQILTRVFDWSYSLLLEPERLLLRRLSIFNGGWQLDAVMEICVDEQLDLNAIPALLAQLVNKALVVADEEAASSSFNHINQSISAPRKEATRYRLLGTIRQFALAKAREAGELELLSQRHLNWYLKLAELAESRLLGATQRTWALRLEAEHNNFRTALSYAFGLMQPNSEQSPAKLANATLGLRLTAPLAIFWDFNGYWNEGHSWLDIALSYKYSPEFMASSTYMSIRARVLHQAGALNFTYSNADALLEQSLSLYEQLQDYSGVAHVLYGLGRSALLRGELTRSQSLYEKSLSLYRDLGDKVGMAELLSGLGLLALLHDDYAAAFPMLEENLSIIRQLGFKRNIATTLHHLSDLAYYQARYAEANSFAEESLALFAELEDRRALGWSNLALAEIAYAENRLEVATVRFEEGLSIYAQLDDDWGLSWGNSGLGRIALQQRQYDRSTKLLEQAQTLYFKMGNKRGRAEVLITQGRLALAQKEYILANELLVEALQLWQEMNNKHSIAGCMEVLAELAIETNDLKRAIQLLGAAQALRDQAGTPLPLIERPRYQANFDYLRTHPQYSAAFDDLWNTTQALSLSEALDMALQTENIYTYILP